MPDEVTACFPRPDYLARGADIKGDDDEGAIRGTHDSKVMSKENIL